MTLFEQVIKELKELPEERLKELLPIIHTFKKGIEGQKAQEERGDWQQLQLQAHSVQEWLNDPHEDLYDSL